MDWKCENSSHVVKQFKVDIYCIVCSIDIMKDSIYEQVLKVWDMLPMTDTTKLLRRLDSIFSMYTDDFIDHCNDILFERYAYFVTWCRAHSSYIMMCTLQLKIALYTRFNVA